MLSIRSQTVADREYQVNHHSDHSRFLVLYCPTYIFDDMAVVPQKLTQCNYIASTFQQESAILSTQVMVYSEAFSCIRAVSNKETTKVSSVSDSYHI